MANTTTSILSIPTELTLIPMVGMNPRTKIYIILCVDPMQTISLGVSRMSQECAVFMLCDDTKTTSSIRLQSVADRTEAIKPFIDRSFSLLTSFSLKFKSNPWDTESMYTTLRVIAPAVGGGMFRKPAKFICSKRTRTMQSVWL